MSVLPEYEPLEYGRSTLSDEDKIYYDDIRDGMFAFQDVIQISRPQNGTLTADDAGVARLKRIGEFVMADHPEIFWYGTTIGFQSIGSTLTTYRRPMLFTQEEAIEKKAQIEGIALDILNEIRDVQGEYEVTKALYSYIAKNTTYNLNADYMHTIYAVFANHEGVCDGYTKAFQYLLNYRGVDNIYLWGYVAEGAHAWCLVRNEGNWYQTDVTWADPRVAISSFTPTEAQEQNLQRDYVTYLYLNLTSSEMYGLNHTLATASAIASSGDSNPPVEIYTIPSCTATECNYYVKESLLFDSYDAEAVTEAVISNLRSQQGPPDSLALADVKFTNDEAWEDFKNHFRITAALSGADMNYANATYSSYASARMRVFIVFW